jgi:hypothetical protein
MSTKKQDDLGEYRKILLATQTINYLAFNIHSVNRDYSEMISNAPNESIKETLIEGKNNKDQILRDVLAMLSYAMEGLADFCNGHDLLVEEDIEITKAAFNSIDHESPFDDDEDE